MSRRVSLGHGLNGVFLIVFGVFALSTLAVGVLTIIAAERAAAVQPGTTATGFYVGGAVFAAVGLLMVRATLRDAGAVAVIDVAGDGTWTLRTRFGRALARVGPDQPRRLELVGREIWLVAVAVPQRRAVVEGRLFVENPGGDRRGLRLAVSGPYTYDRALAALGYDAAAPRPGERTIL